MLFLFSTFAYPSCSFNLDCHVLCFLSNGIIGGFCFGLLCVKLPLSHKIDFLFLFFYDWVVLCNNYRLGLEMVGRGPWGPTGRAWGFEKNLFIKRVKFG